MTQKKSSLQLPVVIAVEGADNVTDLTGQSTSAPLGTESSPSSNFQAQASNSGKGNKGRSKKNWTGTKQVTTKRSSNKKWASRPQGRIAERDTKSAVDISARVSGPTSSTWPAISKTSSRLDTASKSHTHTQSDSSLTSSYSWRLKHGGDKGGSASVRTWKLFVFKKKKNSITVPLYYSIILSSLYQYVHSHLIFNHNYVILFVQLHSIQCCMVIIIVMAVYTLCLYSLLLFNQNDPARYCVYNGPSVMDAFHSRLARQGIPQMSYN